MKKTCQDVGARWLASRVLEQRTGEEALKFADECWTEGRRLSASQAIHYQLVMDVIRRTLTG